MGPATLRFEMSRIPAAVSLQSRGSIQHIVRPRLQELAALRHVSNTDKLVFSSRSKLSRRTSITTAAAAINASNDGASSL